MTTELKTWPEYFEAITEGRKTFEVRKDDRGFNVGDILVLREWEPDLLLDGNYTGSWVEVLVTYILRPEEAPLDLGIKEGWCVMGIQKLVGGNY